MSLDYHLDAIESWKRVCYQDEGEGEMKGEVEAIIFATMSIGLPDITKKNIPEWRHRLNVLHRVDLGWVGSKMVDGERTNWFPDKELLESLIGLRTNASKTTRLAFWKKVMKQVDFEVAPKVVC